MYEKSRLTLREMLNKQYWFLLKTYIHKRYDTFNRG